MGSKHEYFWQTHTSDLREQVRIKAREDQLEIELKLTELGFTETLVEHLRIKGAGAVQGPTSTAGSYIARALKF